MIYGYIVNPVQKRKAKKMPARKTRRRRSTRKGQARKTARRAYMPRRANPVRRRKARRKNPAASVIQDAAIAGAFGAAVAGLFEYLKGEKAKAVAKTGKADAGVPSWMVSGYGEAATIAGVGVALGVLMDGAKGGSFFKKNAKAAASGIVAVGAAQAIKVMMAQRAAAAPVGALYAASPQAAIAAPNQAMNQGVGALYEGALPF